ncbi:hypothetical protein B0H19DRAFT_1273750 [Mycena capillaripes]|nr:hypothetical protein B0H19DRAFT_1273750 [Mycena capillaripes]
MDTRRRSLFQRYRDSGSARRLLGLRPTVALGLLQESHTKIALNNSVTLDDLVTLNPELNPDHTNLCADYWYCVAASPPLNGGATTTTSPSESPYSP